MLGERVGAETSAWKSAELSRGEAVLAGKNVTGHVLALLLWERGFLPLCLSASERGKNTEKVRLHVYASRL